nr:RNA-directed DNA polymerase, eukaryota [Tanacetum cinerariifolium]
MENVDLFSIKDVWGNLAFDYAISPSVGFSRGILGAWDPNLFIKDIVKGSDSFLAIQGTWIPFTTKILIISVFAPQDLSKKRILWEYVSHMIDTWDGESVLLGDFNEFRLEQERFGTSFSVSGANAFNHFITMAGLVDIPLEGYSYTWAHKFASKMSKLDRFLISEGLLSVFPFFSAICLDRHLLDHRPILVHELAVDYDPIPFRIYHSWPSKAGFDKLVEETWKNLNHLESNSIIIWKKKFQALKTSIKIWFKEDKQRSHAFKISIQSRLKELDKKFHQGKGDENSKYFHGIINKKRSQLAIRGVLAEVSEFFLSSKFPPGCNSSFITLILKTQYAKVVKDFLPISLIGLKINLHKSKLMGIGIPQDEVTMAANFIGCNILSTPFNYLGVKVGGIMSRSSSWKEVLAKILLTDQNGSQKLFPFVVVSL